MGDTRAIDSLLRGIETAKSGNKLLARLHLLQAVELAPRDPNCWLWLAWVAESPASAMHSLQRVLDEDPNHELAQLGMKWASAMADYDYQDVATTEESSVATTEDDNTAREDSRLQEDGGQSQATEEEPSETETWEADAEEISEEQDTLLPAENDEEALESCLDSSDIEAEGNGEQEEFIAELAEDELPETESLVAETTGVEIDAESIQIAEENITEGEPSETSQEDSSTDWFTEDETIQADASHEDLQHAVEYEGQDEDSDAIESSDFEYDGESQCETVTELTDSQESDQPGDSQWQETANEETVVAENELVTGHAVGTELGEDAVEESASYQSADDGRDQTPSEDFEPSQEASEDFEPTPVASLESETEEIDRESGVETAIHSDGEDETSEDRAFATAALVEEELSSPEPLAEEASRSQGEVQLEEELASGPSEDENYGVSVLVVDDSPTVRKLVTMTLEKNGFTVGAAADGVVALKSIAELKPRLILLDITMPRLGGYQLCKLIKKHESTKHIPVIMLSGKDGMFDKVRGKFVGCDDYITKPFDPEVLVEKISTQLTEHYGVAGTQS